MGRSNPDDDDERIVLQTFEHKSKLKQQDFDVLTKKVVETYTDVTTIGVVMTTRRLLCFLFSCMGKRSFSLCLQADGTYRLHDGGWTCIDAGTHTITYELGKYVHHFLPLIFCMTMSECEKAYTIVFQTLRDVARAFGVRQHDVLVSHMSIDRTCYIASAALSIWPLAIILQCWPHLMRKFTEGHMTKYLTDRNNLDVIIWLVRMLRDCRSEAQFDYVWDNVFNFLLELDETVFAHYFHLWYMTGVFKNWYVNAGRINHPLHKRISAKQSQNPIEGFHHGGKVRVKPAHLRSTLAKVLGYSMVKILNEAGEIVHKHCPKNTLPMYHGNAVVGADELEVAFAIKDSPDWFHVKGCLEDDNLEFVCRATPESEPINDKVATRFLSTLEGIEPYNRVPNRSTKKGMKKMFKMTHGCNLVVVRKCSHDQQNPFLQQLQLNTGILEHDPSDNEDDSPTAIIALSCDCSVFAENSDECPHCLAVADNLGYIDISVLIASCGAPRNGVGRKRHFKALQKAQTKTRDAVWHLGKIDEKKDKPLWWKGSNVVRTFDDVASVGIVSGYNRKLKQWEIYHNPAPKGHSEYEFIGRLELSDGFALAAELGVRAVV